MNELLNKTLSQIVTEHHQAAPVFEKYGLDFCCKGKRPLQQACEEKQISIQPLLEELNIAIATPASASGFENMSLTELVEYIVRVHHTYVKINMPQILEYAMRVATKHGDKYPYMKAVYILFAELKEEMDQHMAKEEKVLFPRIKQLEMTESPHNSIDYLQAPINVMEHEHDNAGSIMEQIRELTNNYEVPDQACTTFRLCLAALQSFEADLHQHVHLENNLVFPRAIEMFQKLNTTALN